MHNKVSISTAGSNYLLLIHISYGAQLAFVHPSTPIEMPDNKECRGWAYVGSANLSESAW